ncbi:hypothetical protein ACHAW6_000646 [Cyclotella cf. meneghiniana]
MLFYLCDHTHPKIAFDMHHCMHYTYCPTWHHKLAFICIGWYLKGTIDKGMIMYPSNTP